MTFVGRAHLTDVIRQAISFPFSPIHIMFSLDRWTYGDCWRMKMDNSRQLEVPLARSPDASAHVAGCGRTMIYAAIRTGELKARKLGRKTLIFDEDLRAWLAALPMRDAPTA